MVYMGGKGKNNASRSNQTTHFGIMGGLAPSTNVAQGVKRFRLRRARNKQTIPLMPIPGLQYMKEKDILSKNPAGSGGVGLSKVLVDRAIGPCNCGAAPDAAAAVDELFAPSAGCAGETFFASDPPEKVSFSPTGDGLVVYTRDLDRTTPVTVFYINESGIEELHLRWQLCAAGGQQAGWHFGDDGKEGTALLGKVQKDGTVVWTTRDGEEPSSAKLLNCSDPCTQPGHETECSSRMDWNDPPAVLFFAQDTSQAGYEYEEFLRLPGPGDDAAKNWYATGDPPGSSQRVLVWYFCTVADEGDWSLCLARDLGRDKPIATGRTVECGKVEWTDLPYAHLYHCSTNQESCADLCEKIGCASCRATNNQCYTGSADCLKHPGWCQCPPCKFGIYHKSTPPDYIRLDVEIEDDVKTYHTLGPIELEGDGSASWSNKKDGSILERDAGDSGTIKWTLTIGGDKGSVDQQAYEGGPYFYGLQSRVDWGPWGVLIDACSPS